MRGGLQQQRGLADARLAAEQHERARHDAAAEHAIEFTDARADAARRRPCRRRAYSRAPPPPSAGAAPRLSDAGAAFSSTNEFHAPQSGQRPSHLGDCAPHSWQANTDFGGFIVNFN